VSGGNGDPPDLTRFGRQMASVVGAGDHSGRYRATIDPAWNCPLVPHGGLVTAVAARAMGLELANPTQRLRSVTVVFAGPVQPGDVELDVTVLRRGRSMSQLAATVRNPGEPAGHTSLAVFGQERPGFEFTDVEAPEAPPPDACPSFRDGPLDERRPHFNFWEHVEGRAVQGHPPWEQFVPTTSEVVSWYHFDEPPFLGDGTLDPLAAVTLCDTMPGAVGERMGNQSRPWLPPSADLTVHLLGGARSEWLLARNRARHAGEGYASVELELWDPGRGLVAYGTQMMVFTFPEGPPEPHLRRPPS
jgi:acyl-CoA thioesterase